MPRKAKPFINKKNATTYHLYQRSQRDTENITGAGSILLNSKAPLLSSDASIISMSTLQKELEKLGALEDDAECSDNYNYSQHLRPISGKGVYYSCDGTRKENYATTCLFGEEIVEEVPRQLDSIMLSTECMDEEIAHALFDEVEEGEFEELLDDFCITANEETLQDDIYVEPVEFDYEKHIQGLLKKAKQDEEDDVFDFFKGIKPCKDDRTNQKLEETLAEYDSDEIGSLEEECQDIQGFRHGEEDIVTSALNEFLEESKQHIYIQSEPQINVGGGNYKALVGTKLVPVDQLEEYVEEENLTIEDMLQEADHILAQPYQKPPVEDVLIDGKSYYSIKSHNPWDCETILSTYSNLDNHPTTIQRNKNNKPHKPQIQLSNKTGLPIFAQDYEAESDEDLVNLGLPRNKKETPEEKKARKELLKLMKRQRREKKQQLKVAFKEEFQKQATLLVNDDVAGKSVFRYT